MTWLDLLLMSAPKDAEEGWGQLARSSQPDRVRLADGQVKLDQVAHDLEAAGDLGMLVIVAEEEQREHLASHVTVLPPPADLVVGQFRQDSCERRRLRVLVDLVAPAEGRDATDLTAPPHQRARATDAAGELAGRVRNLHHLVAPSTS